MFFEDVYFNLFDYSVLDIYLKGERPLVKLYYYLDVNANSHLFGSVPKDFTFYSKSFSQNKEFFYRKLVFDRTFNSETVEFFKIRPWFHSITQSYYNNVIPLSVYSPLNSDSSFLRNVVDASSK